MDRLETNVLAGNLKYPSSLHSSMDRLETLSILSSSPTRSMFTFQYG